MAMEEAYTRWLPSSAWVSSCWGRGWRGDSLEGKALQDKKGRRAWAKGSQPSLALSHNHPQNTPGDPPPHPKLDFIKKTWKRT
jgi:hypothetical protein